jgi:hypothetical protein
MGEYDLPQRHGEHREEFVAKTFKREEFVDRIYKIDTIY